MVNGQSTKAEHKEEMINKQCNCALRQTQTLLVLQMMTMAIGREAGNSMGACCVCPKIRVVKSLSERLIITPLRGSASHRQTDHFHSHYVFCTSSVCLCPLRRTVIEAVSILHQHHQPHLHEDSFLRHSINDHLQRQKRGMRLSFCKSNGINQMSRETHREKGISISSIC